MTSRNAPFPSWVLRGRPHLLPCTSPLDGAPPRHKTCAHRAARPAPAAIPLSRTRVARGMIFPPRRMADAMGAFDCRAAPRPRASAPRNPLIDTPIAPSAARPRPQTRLKARPSAAAAPRQPGGDARYSIAANVARPDVPAATLRRSTSIHFVAGRADATLSPLRQHAIEASTATEYAGSSPTSTLATSTGVLLVCRGHRDRHCLPQPPASCPNPAAPSAASSIGLRARCLRHS